MSAIQLYFGEFDLAFHPDSKLKKKCICLICWEQKNEDKELIVGEKTSVTCLESHLQIHPEAYKEYLSKKSKITVEKASGSHHPNNYSQPFPESQSNEKQF